MQRYGLHSSARVMRSAFVLLLFLLGTGVITSAVAQEVSTLSEQDIERGKVHYMASCARCHGVDGNGGEGPPLSRARLPRAPDDSALIRIMSGGIQGTAMSGARWLSAEDLREVAGYVRSMAPPEQADPMLPGDPARGRQLFEREGCDGCHTVGGVGTGRGPDLTSVGLRRGTTYLRKAILDPAEALPRGLTAMASDFVDYLVVRVVERDGSEFQGMRMNEDTYTIQLKDRRGQLRSFYKPSLSQFEKQFDRSLMRSYRDDYTGDEIDDLLTYLMTLTENGTRVIS